MKFVTTLLIIAELFETLFQNYRKQEEEKNVELVCSADI